MYIYTYRVFPIYINLYTYIIYIGFSHWRKGRRVLPTNLKFTHTPNLEESPPSRLPLVPANFYDPLRH